MKEKQIIMSHLPLKFYIHSIQFKLILLNTLREYFRSILRSKVIDNYTLIDGAYTITWS